VFSDNGHLSHVASGIHHRVLILPKVNEVLAIHWLSMNAFTDASTMAAH
jgi:hypothetical protein